MRIDIITLFPEMCEAVISESIIGRAQDAGIIEIKCHNIRDYSTDNRKMEYSRGYPMILLATLFYMIIYAGPYIKLPELIAGSRLCSTEHLLLIALFIILLDLIEFITEFLIFCIFFKLCKLVIVL